MIDKARMDFGEKWGRRNFLSAHMKRDCLLYFPERRAAERPRLFGKDYI